MPYDLPRGWNELFGMPQAGGMSAPPEDQDRYLRDIISQLLQPNPPMLRGATMDTTRWTPMSVERNFGPSGSAQMNPDFTARLYGALQNRPVETEYQPPMGAQYPPQNLDAAGALEKLKQSQAMAPLKQEAEAQKIRTEEAGQGLIGAQTRYQEQLATVNPQKAKLADTLIDNYARFDAQQAAVASQRARAQQQPLAVMGEVGVGSEEELWRWFDQQQEELRRQQEATARALKSLIPDIDLTALGAAPAEPTDGGGALGGGPAGGLSPAGQKFMGRFKR